MKSSGSFPKGCEWTREKTATLITLYQAHQCLWNNFIESYKNKEKRMKAINAICGQLNITKEDFAKKVHNLRNQFNAEMKKLEKRNESSSEAYHSSWEHYESLKFLKEVIAPRPGYMLTFKDNRKFDIKYSVENIVEEEEQQHSNGSQECETASSRSRVEFNNIPIVSREEILDSKYHRPKSECIETQEYIQNGHQSEDQAILRKRQQSQDYVQIENPRALHATTIVGLEAEPYKKRLKEDGSDGKFRDQWDVFGEFVAGEFRNLNSELSRKKLKRKIMQMMLEVGEEDDGININIPLN